MACSVELSLTNLFIVLILYFAGKKAWAYYKQVQLHKKLEKWDHTKQGVVTLHMFERGKTCPNASPFVLKLETYLRMANIPYEIDTTDEFGPKGKSPWISFNGTHMEDSQLIIEFLNKKLDKDLNHHLNPEQKSISRMVRILLENHFLWGLAYHRWIAGYDKLRDIFSFPMWALVLIGPFIKSEVKKALWYQGMGRHSVDELTQMTEKDLYTVAEILGNKKFIIGDQPCEDDAAIFGMLCQCVYVSPGTSYERLVNGELKVLKEYCLRMRELYWKDWSDCLAKAI